MTKTRPNGLGIWIAFAAMALARFDGSWTKVAQAVKGLGVSWVAIRTTDTALQGAALEGMIRAFHAAGIAVYGWHYSYPDEKKVATQVAHMVRVQNAGADGHFVNAEIEFTGEKIAAVRLMQAIRNALPEWWIGHAPLGWLAYHPTWPYEEFLAFCDGVAPQLYWTELKHGQYSAEFRAQIELWKNGHRHGGKTADPWVLPGGKQVLPIGVTYGKGDVTGSKVQPPGVLKSADLDMFLGTDVQLAPAPSLYSLEVAHADTLALLTAKWSWTTPPAA